MNDLPAVRWLLRTLVHPGWAPLSVVALHLVLAEFGLTRRFDHLLHFSGGASMAYFVYVLLARAFSDANRVPRWMLYLLGFTSACTVAVFWEFAEFAGDRLRGTAVQQSLPETMGDLLFGVMGAAVTLLAITLIRLWVHRHLRETGAAAAAANDSPTDAAGDEPGSIPGP